MFLSCLCELSVLAGREIMEVYEGSVEVWQKADRSPLTSADLRADQVIRGGLEKAFPGVFILSEESSSGKVACHDTFFLVDPLDGTKEFVKRNGEFTVNIAYVAGGLPLAGVVYAPALDELYFAGRGLGVWKRSAGQEHALATCRDRGGRALRVLGSRSHGGDRLAAWLASLTVAHSLDSAGSSLKFCRIAEGRADLYPRFGPTSQWDTAAAQAILEEAGGCVVDLAGGGLRYGLERPVLNPDFVAAASWELHGMLFPPGQVKG